MNKLRSLPKKPLNNNHDQFINKLGARLFLVLIFLAAVGEKILTIYNSSEDNENSPTLYLLTIFDILILVILIFVEYFMHRKLGPKALKYTCVVDILLFIFFSLDWIVSIEYIFNQSGKADLGVLPIVSMLEFTSFGWKVLVQVFIFRQWFLRILSPILACIVVICFGAIYVPDDLVNILVRGIAQMLYVVCLFYFEQKLNFKLVSTSRKQEKWMKINEFILSNIPENIAIMDSQGSISYISQYFKEFIRGFNNNMTMENLFKSIKNLQPVEQEFMSSADNLLLLDKSSSSRSPDPSFIQSQRNLIFTERVDSFHDLLRNFRSMIQTKQIKEKSFLIFNGKLHTADLIEKSIEVKISFIRQNLKDYIIIILRDTTQRDLLVSLEDHNKYKDHLLASVSHELRAPLNGNINLIEASIRSPDVPPHIIESLLTPALRSGKLLLHLINDILDMSQIKAQKLRLVFQFADIRETLVNTIQLLEIQAEKKEINLQVNIDHRLPVKFCTDHVRLSQIVLNLMNNAIKFTQLGVVKLTAELTEDTRSIKITIEDSGIGMKPDDLKKLFNKYTRLESNQSARHKKMNPTGVGLGLNIAHNLADLLGPRANTAITATSQVGKGSKFSFVIENKETGLQLQTSKKASNIEESYLIPDEIDLENHSTLDLKMNARFSSRSFKKLSQIGTPLGKPKCKCSKVLVIDDDHFNVMAMESILNSLNAAGDYVYDGKSAIEKILNKIRYSLCLNDCAPYYAIFIDQEMPGFSGAETVQELRSLQRQKVIPEMTLIGCTGHTGKSEVENFVKSGLDQCIQKPVSIDIIKNILIRARAPPAVDSFKASASRL